MLQNTTKAYFSSMWFLSMRNTLFFLLKEMFFCWEKHFFDLKVMFLCKFLQICFKTPVKIGLAVCGSFWWEKYFFDWKRCFLVISSKMLQNNRNSLFSSMWLILMRKTLFWLKEMCDSFWWEKHFWLKEIFFINTAKMLQNTREAYFSSMWFLSMRNTLFF